MSTLSLRSTKAELFSAYTATNAELLALRHEARAMRDELAMTRCAPASVYARQPAEKHKDWARYTAYVNSQCELASRNGAKCAEYMGFAAWCVA